MISPLNKYAAALVLGSFLCMPLWVLAFAAPLPVSANGDEQTHDSFFTQDQHGDSHHGDTEDTHHNNHDDQHEHGHDGNNGDDHDDTDGAGTPHLVTTGVLAVKKVVVGGSATPEQFSFVINDGAATSFNLNGENDFTLATGTYNIAETATSTYTPSYDNCSAIVLLAAATSTCTITNTFVPPVEATPATTTDPVDTTPSDTSSGGGTDTHNDITYGGGFSVGAGGGGVVLGTSTEATSTATTSCGPLLTHYLRMGGDNDSSDVTKLQDFLNTHLNAHLEVTGVFDMPTFEAVKKFQLTYWQDILSPWIAHGLKSDHTATGYVYKTTERMINRLSCSSLDIPLPELP